MSVAAAALEYATLGLPVFPCKPRGKEPLTQHGFKDATTDPDKIRDWWRQWPDANIGLPTGAISGLFVLDVDPRNGGDKSLDELTAKYGPLPVTAEQTTGGGGSHLFFSHSGGTLPKELATGIDIKGDGGYVIAAPSIHPSGGCYQLKNAEGPKALLKPAAPPAWMLAHIVTVGHNTRGGAAMAETKWKPGQRNNKLTALGGAMRRRGMSREAIEAALIVENRQKCEPPLSQQDVKNIAKSVASYAPLETTNEASWPDGLPDEAFHGIAGEIVKAIEPHTEADSAALLIQFLVVFGNIIGRCAHFCAESTPHFLNLFAVLVGQTAAGRKGTALGWVQRIVADIDPKWKQHCIAHGLVSGEGLVANVRDQVTKMVEEKKTGIMREEVIDPGVDDKRLLVIEQEFGSVLQAAERQTNTLSAVMREAWDGNNLRTMAKNNPACATNPHISIIGHITDEELRQLLTKTAVCNGFANRFLWVCTTRSKCLPNGGNLDPVTLAAFTTRLKQLVAFARTVGLMERDQEAAAIWNAVYPDLTGGMPGMLGKATSRAAAHTMRLACIYALLDSCSVIRVAHMLAALWVWGYCEDSARFIFGQTLGHGTADHILFELRQRSVGMSRNEIRDYFQRNKSAAEISHALHSLEANGLVRSEKRPGTGGRDTEMWFPLAHNAENAVYAVAANPADVDLN
jgi:hypothetical protein